MPISPDEVGALKTKLIPVWVFSVWDKLIATAWDDTSAVVKQADAETALSAANPGEPVDIIRSGWLDIEDSYRSTGWSVEYDKPGYNESYGAIFTFRKKK
jgi:hypothetical protein